MPVPPIHVLRLVVGPLETNCFLLWRASHIAGGAEATPALVFDPGGAATEILEALKSRQLVPAAFLLTHCHGDHIGALAKLKAAYPAAPIVVHKAEAHFLKDPLRNLSYFLGMNVTAPDAERTIQDGEELSYAGLRLRALHVPGHTPGGTAYFLDEADGGPRLFCGDLLFAGGIGRTDFPGSDSQEVLVAGIQQKLFVLPDETIMHPGHGPDTTIGEEKHFNPFCGLGQ